MLKVSYIKIYKCKNRYQEREPGGAGGAGPCAPSPGSFCCLSFFCVFFKKKNQPQIKTRFLLPAGSRSCRASERSSGWRWGSSSVPRGRGSSPGSWHGWSFSRDSRGQRDRAGLGSTERAWGGCSAPALGGQVGTARGRWGWMARAGGDGRPGQVGMNGPGRWDAQPSSHAGGSPLPRPQNGSREVGGPLLGPCPARALRGSPQSCCWEQSQISFWGSTPAPRAPLGTSPAGQPGRGWGRKRRVWEEERKGPSPPPAGGAGSCKTLFGGFSPNCPCFQLPYFFVRSHLQRCHNKTLECPECPCGASPSLQTG
ncbi:translation initiation factor IF-2-like isoform X3 [Melozone crissalis]|uniref:translation initiation factor IF-2-like isoform X3 n=1 Tax=Melozone crissalis TaxID=40204 RepID=UPI0023DB93E7|nr:translation initiation factor IF-2-like isoform X3 [Melozone crissalis]